MKTAKLHELVQMAKDGKLFTALTIGGTKVDHNYFKTGCWDAESVLRDWSYERTPLVVYVNDYKGNGMIETNSVWLSEEEAKGRVGRREGRTIKFIEVLE